MPIKNSVSAQLDKRIVQKRFARSANTYDQAAFVQREIGARLLERLDYMRLQPSHIIDLGCGTGWLSQQLLMRYQDTTVSGVDFAQTMLDKAGINMQGSPRFLPVLAAASQLPLDEDSTDLVISNLMLPWCNEVSSVFQQALKVLKPNSLILFSSLGPDTLSELRSCWSTVDQSTHIHDFVDLHDVGDALVRAGFHAPVMERELLTVTYPNIKTLFQDLKHLGMTNASIRRLQGLTGRQRFDKFYTAYAAYQQADGSYPVTYELIYGHAWVGPIKASAQPDYFIPLKAY